MAESQQWQVSWVLGADFMFFRLLRLQYKRMLRFLPALAIGFVVLLVIGAGFCVLAADTLYKNDEDSKIKIALYMPNEKSESLMMSAIERMDSAKENLEIIYTSSDKVRPMVEDGLAYCGIMIPEDFVKDIIVGRDAPAKVILPRQNTIDSLIVRSYLASGISDITAAQAGVTAFMDCLKGSYTDRDILEINMFYMNAAFGREKMFREETVSATDSLPVLNYYVINGLIILTLLLGTAMLPGLIKYNDPIIHCLKAKGISSLKVYFINFMICLTMYAVFTAAFVILLWAVGDRLPATGLSPAMTLISVANLLCLAVFDGAFISFVYFVFDRSAILVTVLFALVCGFLSGSLIPVSFLPERAAVLSDFMPIKLLYKGLVSLYDSAAVNIAFIVPCIAFAVFALIITFKDRIK